MLSELVMGTMHTRHPHRRTEPCLLRTERRVVRGLQRRPSTSATSGHLHATPSRSRRSSPAESSSTLPAHLGEACFPKGYAITPEDVEGALERQGVEIQRNDAVLIRTGYMSVWPDPERRSPPLRRRGQPRRRGADRRRGCRSRRRRHRGLRSASLDRPARARSRCMSSF